VKLFRTDDLNIAGFLQEQGFPLVTTERDNRHVVFLFDDSKDKAEGAVMLYLNGGTVAAVRFADRLRHLKTLVMRGLNA
jgi:hypothetical protein